VRTELQRLTDATARHAAGGIASNSAVARSRALQAAGDNKVDGAAYVLANSNVTLGRWNSNNKTFTPLNDNDDNVNAIRIRATRTAAEGNGVPLIFARVIGRQFADVRVETIAMLNPSIDINTFIKSTDNPYLAGMPSGTLANVGNPANNPDRAPQQRPNPISGVNLVPGEALTFDNITGTANNFQTNVEFNPDGNFNWIIQNWSGAEHGKSDLRAPINCVVGVFLSDAQPNLSPAPPMLNFSTVASRDFVELKPQLKQLFFIGDGRRDNGELQRFVVPEGATRLFICNWDGWEWNNNIGGRNLSVRKIGNVALVK
jgi:hypothetical protein